MQLLTPLVSTFQSTSWNSTMLLYALLVVYSDPSCTNNFDLSTQLGFIILETDETSQLIPLTSWSKKSKLLFSLAMVAEVIAFSDQFDASFTLSTELLTLIKRTIGLDLFTGYESLFDVISKGSHKSEKGMMLGICTARDGLKSKEFSKIGFVRSEANLPDGLNKHSDQNDVIILVQYSKHIKSPLEWIIRHSSDILHIQELSSLPS